MAPSFLQEITECCRAIQTEAVALNPGLGPLLVLPLHPGVGRAAQKVYEAPEEGSWERRVVVTHWLGDSSFSLGSVGFVIDTGLELRSVSGDGELGSALRQAESVGRGSGFKIICSSYRLPGDTAQTLLCAVGVGELWRRQGLTCGPLPWLTLQVYNPRIRAESQVLRPISRSQAESRMQRAAGSPRGESPPGHTGSNGCWRAPPAGRCAALPRSQPPSHRHLPAPVLRGLL